MSVKHCDDGWRDGTDLCSLISDVFPSPASLISPPRYIYKGRVPGPSTPSYKRVGEGGHVVPGRRGFRHNGGGVSPPFHSSGTAPDERYLAEFRSTSARLIVNKDADWLDPEIKPTSDSVHHKWPYIMILMQKKSELELCNI